MQQVVIGTAGHIDHGKTTLVEALTGINTDTLDQEKQRGITIDLGFAYLDDDITIVDVPGHQKFIRNMVAGASTVHIGLLVIAADDGIMPQTIEHLHILNSLLISKGITVITKIDLVDDDWLDLIVSEIKKLEQDTIFQDRPILMVDSISGKGIDELKEVINKEVKTISIENKSEYYKMHVDRIFSKKGYGTVVTGTVKSGVLKVGNSVEVLPDRLIAQVRGIQTHGGSVQEVKTGDRAALNLTKVDKAILKRGTTLSSPGMMDVTNKLLAYLSMSPHTSWTIKKNQRVRIHIGTAEIFARVKFFGKEMSESQTGNVILHFEHPIGVTMDEPFIVRSYSPMETIASGIVLDTNGNYDRQFLEQCPSDKLERLKSLIGYYSNKPKTIEKWSRKYFIPVKELNKKILLIEAKVTEKDCLVYFENDLDFWKKEIISYVEEKCKNNSFHNFVELNNIVQSLEVSEKWAKHVIKKLIDSNILVFKSGRISLFNQSLKLNQKIEIDLKNIIKLIENADSHLITVKELIEISKFNPQKIKEMIFLLNNQNRIIQLNENLVMHAKSFEKLLACVREHFKKLSTLSVLDFKKISNLTRKNAIPILEFLDSKKYTKRLGGNRKIGEALIG